MSRTTALLHALLEQSDLPEIWGRFDSVFDQVDQLQSDVVDLLREVDKSDASGLDDLAGPLRDAQSAINQAMKHLTNVKKLYKK